MLAMLLVSGAIAASGWEASFPQERLAEQVSQDATVMVVVGNSEAKDAAKILVRQLRGTAKVKLAIPGDALGDMSGKSDSDIVAAAKAQPVGLVWVLRVYDDIAMLTILNLKGEVVAGHQVTQGTALQVATANVYGQAGLGSRSAAVDSVIIGKGPTDAQKQYQKRAIFYGTQVSAYAYGNQVVAREQQVPQLGYKGKPLYGTAFLEAVGEKQLASDARSGVVWAATGLGALILSPVGFVAGLIGSGSRATQSVYNSDTHDYDSEYSSGYSWGIALATTGVLLGGGILAMVKGFGMMPDVDESKTQELITAHNERLRQELGLSTAEAEQVERRVERDISPTMAPMFGEYKGVALGVTF